MEVYMEIKYITKNFELLNSIEFSNVYINRFFRQMVDFIREEKIYRLQNSIQDDEEYGYTVEYHNLLRDLNIEVTSVSLSDLGILYETCSDILSASKYCGYNITFVACDQQKRSRYNIIGKVVIRIMKDDNWRGKIKIDNTSITKSLENNFIDICKQAYAIDNKYDVTNIYEMCIIDPKTAEYDWSKSIVKQFIDRYILLKSDTSYFTNKIIKDYSQTNLFSNNKESEVKTVEETKIIKDKHCKYSDAMHNYACNLFMDSYLSILEEEYRKLNHTVSKKFLMTQIKEPLVNTVLEGFSAEIGDRVELASQSIWGWVRKLPEFRKYAYGEGIIEPETQYPIEEVVNKLEDNSADDVVTTIKMQPETSEIENIVSTVEDTQEDVVDDRALFYRFIVSVDIKVYRNKLFGHKLEIVHYKDSNVIAQSEDAAWVQVETRILSNFSSLRTLKVEPDATTKQIINTDEVYCK